MKGDKFVIARALAALVPVGAAVAIPITPAAAIPVFDVTNYTQNLLQAARSLEQINHQIESLQNQAAMLRGMTQNLKTIDFPQLEELKASLARIDQLMGKAQGIGFTADGLDQRFRSMFPGAVDNALRTDRRASDAKARLETALDSFRHSMTVQAKVVANVRDDAVLLSELSKRSEGAVGSLQAQQATNQLLALSTKQQLQLQDMIAAEYQSAGIERARRAQAEADARASTRRFLGSGKAYSSGH